MFRIWVTDRQGVEKHIDHPGEYTLMEVIRDNGFGELLALCGGCCSCATCHVYVDPTSMNRLLPMNDDENSLLDSSTRRKFNSRLACQILLTGNLDGMRVTIAPED